jgi:hypothetical protein
MKLKHNESSLEHRNRGFRLRHGTPFLSPAVRSCGRSLWTVESASQPFDYLGNIKKEDAFVEMIVKSSSWRQWSLIFARYPVGTGTRILLEPLIPTKKFTCTVCLWDVRCYGIGFDNSCSPHEHLDGLRLYPGLALG